ncbi:hypothetical protein ACUH9X_04605 [Dermabacteraceae bacterium P13147]
MKVADARAESLLESLRIRRFVVAALCGAALLYLQGASYLNGEIQISSLPKLGAWTLLVFLPLVSAVVSPYVTGCLSLRKSSPRDASTASLAAQPSMTGRLAVFATTYLAFAALLGLLFFIFRIDFLHSPSGPKQYLYALNLAIGVGLVALITYAIQSRLLDGVCASLVQKCIEGFCTALLAPSLVLLVGTSAAFHRPLAEKTYLAPHSLSVISASPLLYDCLCAALFGILLGCSAVRALRW